MSMKITNDIRYVGVNDHEIDLFEGQYIVPEGMAYNSYLIADEKTAVMDSVDGRFADEWINNIIKESGGREPDYLVIQHMEPDHSSSIAAFMERFPHTVIVSGAKSFPMLKNFYGAEYPDRQLTVGEGDKLELGRHTLNFITAPMVHWPEVIMTYDSADRVVFSADAFGKFGANDIENDDWACEARRYYFGIVGKYGAQVQAVLKKLSAFSVDAVCPLHGPVLTANLDYYLALYDIWSAYGVETDGVVINYTSVYGNTKKAAELLAEKLEKYGCPKVAVNDLARCDMAEAVEDAFRYGKIVLATTTYNGDIFPFMREFIADLVERGMKNKKIALIENGSWGPMAIKKMTGMLEGLKNIEYCENSVTIKSGLSDENIAAIDALAKELC